MRMTSILKGWNSVPSHGRRYVATAGMRLARICDEPPLPGFAQPWPEARQERGLVVEPERERRHGDPHVFPEHLGEGRDVGRLVCGDRALEQRPLLGRHVRWRPADPPMRTVGGHGRPRALERAVHRRDRHVEEVRGLLRRPFDDLAQDEHRPLAWRQELDGGEERELDRLALDRRGFGLLLAWRDLVEELVRVGLQPRHLAERVERV